MFHHRLRHVEAHLADDALCSPSSTGEPQVLSLQALGPRWEHMLPSVDDAAGDPFKDLSGLRAAIGRLPWLQRRLLQWRLGAVAPPESIEAVATRLGLSPERVAELELESLRALKQVLAEVNA